MPRAICASWLCRWVDHSRALAQRVCASDMAVSGRLADRSNDGPGLRRSVRDVEFARHKVYEARLDHFRLRRISTTGPLPRPTTHGSLLGVLGREAGWFQPNLKAKATRSCGVRIARQESRTADPGIFSRELSFSCPTVTA